MKRVFILSFLMGIAITFASCSNNTQQRTEQLAADQTYTCTMHNEVMSDHPGKCPKCGMKLVKQKMTEQQKKLKAEGTFVKPKE